MNKTFKFSNKEIIIILKEVLAAMEVKNFNVFKIRAYQNVITIIEGLTISVYNLWENKRLDEITGIGPTLKEHINELFTKGKVPEFESAKYGLPDGMFELIGLRGIGAKKAFKLAMAFHIDKREDALDIVKKAAENNEIKVLPGFGEKSEISILESITESKKIKKEKPRMLLSSAEEVATRLLAYLKMHPEIVDAVVLGSLRRRSPTVGDLDIAIRTTDSEAAIKHFLAFPEIEDVLVEGTQRAAVVISNDIQVDIRVCEERNFGSMIQYFTGSKSHNIVLRTNALERGFSLSEYGIKKNDVLHEFSSEEDFYKFLDLDYIVPELRQGKNEVELAYKHKLPKLVTLEDIRGDLHSHTIASDGVNTLQEMVMKANQLGYEYLGITDHVPSLTSRGYDEVARIIETTKKTIESLNKSFPNVKVLFGYEINILADATIALPDELMKMMDYAVGAIHGAFNQSREEITKRLIAAAEHPYIDIIGHPSGRLINERDPVDVNWPQFFSVVKENNKIIEINSQPNRLDLSEELVEIAVEKGISLVINTDAHAIEQLDNMRYGLDVARRGWCEKKHIINTLDFAGLKNILAESSSR